MRRLVGLGVGAGIVAVLGWVLPGWTVFLLSLAMARGLAALSVVLLIQAGLVSFGQGLFFATGAYAVAFTMQMTGGREIVVLMAAAVLASVLMAAFTGLLIARYREIFFAMLSLAFSMILYGILVKAYHITGGTDGIGIAPPTVLTFSPPIEALRRVLYAFTVFCTAVMIGLVDRYVHSPLGYAVRAIRDNEVRVAYLGHSVYRIVYVTYLLAGVCAGVGGALTAINVGHVDPQLAYWTTSGEFVFVALLGGIEHVFAPLMGAVVFEFLRTYAFKYFPYVWQMALGLVMLGIILLMPGGLWAPITWIRLRGQRWHGFWKPSA